MAIAIQSEILGLIMFEMNIFSSETFFNMNPGVVLCSIFLDIVNMVSRGMFECYVGCWNHGFHVMFLNTMRKRIKERLTSSLSSFHKHLCKCKNIDNLSIKIEEIICNVGNLRIKEVLLIATLHLHINT